MKPQQNGIMISTLMPSAQLYGCTMIQPIRRELRTETPPPRPVMKICARALSCCGALFLMFCVSAVATDPVSPEASLTSFHLYLENQTFEETCRLVPSVPETLDTCGYNRSTELVLIIHGWTMNGLMESWMFSLAAALKRRVGGVNVLISDWRVLALQAYPLAARNSRRVGREVAALLRWLQEAAELRPERVHLIGFSLGAHAAGFTGSHFTGAGKLGRITGLDPAGPNFESASPSDRLSRDDALFVDVIHTFAGTAITPGVGIRRPVGHVDFYPNGGSFQPGCKMLDIYSNVYQYGLQGVPRTIKCGHERAVQLFTDSLWRPHQVMRGFRCRHVAAFLRGQCLDCKQNRCSALGYEARHTGRSHGKGLYLRTAAEAPYRVLHYQVRVHLREPLQRQELPLTIQLNGTAGRSQGVALTLRRDSSAQERWACLLTLEAEVGVVSSVRLRWRDEQLWSGWMRRVRDIVSWSGTPAEPELQVQRIHIKSGDTQERWWFCGVSGAVTAGEEQEFRGCAHTHTNTHA